MCVCVYKDRRNSPFKKTRTKRIRLCEKIFFICPLVCVCVRARVCECVSRFDYLFKDTWTYRDSFFPPSSRPSSFVRFFLRFCYFSSFGIYFLYQPLINQPPASNDVIVVWLSSPTYAEIFSFHLSIYPSISIFPCSCFNAIARKGKQGNGCCCLGGRGMWKSKVSLSNRYTSDLIQIWVKGWGTGHALR